MKISQREARRLKKRVEQLENELNGQRNAWARDYPGGTNIGRVDGVFLMAGKVGVARQLAHAVVAVNDGENLLLYALPLPAVQ